MWRVLIFITNINFFESQYERLDEFINQVAERIRALGHYAPATLASFPELTSLSEASRAKNDSRGFNKELLPDHEAIIIKLRENINRFVNDYQDSGTSDFITGLVEEHEKSRGYFVLIYKFLLQHYRAPLRTSRFIAGFFQDTGETGIIYSPKSN